MKVTIYRGQPIKDKDGKPTGKRHPIQTRENFYWKQALRGAEAKLGGSLTKAEKLGLRKLLATAMAEGTS